MAMAYKNRLTLAALPRTERGRPLVLGADPKGVSVLYANGNSVIIRNLENPAVTDIYTQHSCQVNVAKYSPSGFYVASADKSGKIRIWDTVNAEHVLKNEYQPISGPVNDLAWSSDNQRIVCVGEGREKFGHVFLADTGTSNGDITGQSRPVNSCDFKPSRPFRIVTGSEDNTSAVYEGPPFKFKSSKTEHSRYVQSVRYSPDGNYWVSGGFDGKMFLYEGKDSTLVGELVDDKCENESAHAGGVYAVAWSGDSKKVLSASGDKTCKIWEVESRSVLTTFNMGPNIEDQQLSCAWVGDHLLSVSLTGFINFLDPATGTVSKVLMGHNKPITKMTLSEVDGKTFIITAGSDGRVIRWSLNGETELIEGEGHNSQVNGLVNSGNGTLATVGIDDSMRSLSLGDSKYNPEKSHKLKAQPKAIDHHNPDGVTVVATVNSLVVLQGNTVREEIKVDYEPSCVSISKEPIDGETLVAVGDAGQQEGRSVHIYTLQDGGALLAKAKAPLSGSVTDVAYSPDGKYLVASDSNRKVTLLSTADYQKVNPREWGFHTAKVTCVAWSPDSQFVVSGSLDCSVIIWSVKHPDKHLIIPCAHVQSQINGVQWIDNKTVVSAGQDGNVKIWDIDWQIN